MRDGVLMINPPNLGQDLSFDQSLVIPQKGFKLFNFNPIRD
jgi:hypothetical protein